MSFSKLAGLVKGGVLGKMREAVDGSSRVRASQLPVKSSTCWSNLLELVGCCKLGFSEGLERNKGRRSFLGKVFTGMLEGKL